MTLKEFNSLKLEDRVCLPDKDKKGKYWSTEVLEIDKKNKKIKVFMQNEFLSYKYIQLVNREIYDLSYSVGIVK